MAKFQYKSNNYLRKQNGEYCIRSIANQDGCGYSYYKITDEEMIEILDSYLEELDG